MNRHAWRHAAHPSKLIDSTPASRLSHRSAVEVVMVAAAAEEC